MDQIICKLREPKILGMAIFDWIMTFIGIYLITIIVKYYYKNMNFYKLYLHLGIVTIIIGIILHKILGIDTMLGYYLGLNIKPKRIKCI